MGDIEGIHPEFKRIFREKEERRHRLAALSYPEKVDIVVQMQRMIAPILQARGIDVRPWDIEPQSDGKID